MAYRLFLTGMILFLSSACLPHLNFPTEKVHSDVVSTAQARPSLVTRSERDFIFPQTPAVSWSEANSPAYNLDGLRRLPSWPEPPASEESESNSESNDDFSLEVLPGDLPKKESEFDIPIVVNEKVEQFVTFFQTTLKNRFSSWLGRSGKYIPFMRSVLRENGLPEDLVYMALIESGFNPYAYSRSKACGPWQFIYFTGKRYGLKVDWWVDERRDPEKSTVAAAKYLKDLYDMFACWYLAAAGYNAGENKIASAMKRYQTEDFWELTKYPFLKQETKDYVPQMIAAALIAKDPEKYGFMGIDYEEPLQYDKVKVPPITDLALVAKACELTTDELKDLNPELQRWCTPPDADYEIKVPFGKKDLFLRNFESLQPAERPRYRIHVVKKGDTLPKVALAYRVSGESILETNQLKKAARLTPGMNLVIPVSAHPGPPDPRLAAGAKKKGDGKAQPPQGNGDEEIIYTIKKGDTLWDIANEMGVNIGALSQWNKLHPEKKLRPGDKLKVRVASGSAPAAANVKKEGSEIVYEVRGGDTLWAIAKKYNLSIGEIRSWNNLEEAGRIFPADRLKLRVGGIRSSALN
jgi:membrane-bound lytic murein transglycosylase D